jgi:hypothetical protein
MPIMWIFPYWPFNNQDKKLEAQSKIGYIGLKHG